MRFLAVLLFLVFVPSVFAEESHIQLLALLDRNGIESGGVVDLYLDVASGRERVFLDTFPQTKITTQISLRFAQQIACKEVEVDCSAFDFFYTIRAFPGVVGGPSAGGAATVLTVAMLKNLTLDPTVAMTGTINSGGLIGPVSGLKQKIEAASQAGLKKVLIPKGSRFFKDNDYTIDLLEYGKNLSVDVREVATVGEAVYEFSGYEMPAINDSLVIQPRYSDIMKKVSEDLCSRNKVLKEALPDDALASNFTSLAIEAFDQQNYYTAASHCFRSNVILKDSAARNVSLNRTQIEHEMSDVRTRIARFQNGLNAINISTITDVQTLMAVQERLDETIENVGQAEAFLNASDLLNAKLKLAYAGERLYSAMSWSLFFKGNDKKFEVTSDRLKKSCIAKIGEAEERLNYVQSYVMVGLSGIKKNVEHAYDDMLGNNFIMCFYRAGKAKAEADLLLGALGLQPEAVDEFVNLKLNATRRMLVKAQRKGVFPIMSYSYYEYSKSLQAFDKPSSWLFAEYALELANVDMYFGGNGVSSKVTLLDKNQSVLLGVGFVTGVLVTFIVLRIVPSKKRNKRSGI